MILKFLTFLLLISANSLAQSAKLNNILAERRALYTEWKDAIEQKSGIFGNQTKADLEEVNDILKKIIKKDNEIVDELEATKANDFQALTEKYNKLLEENEQLSKQKKSLENKLAEEKEYQKANQSHIQRAEGDRIVMGIFAFSSLLLLSFIFLKMRNAKKQVKALESIIKNANR